MQPFLRLAVRAPPSPRRLPILSYSTQTTRFAQQSYGQEESGMEQGDDMKNPKADLEHPGPEAPAKKGTASSSSSSSSQPQSNKTKKGTTSQGGSPAIHRPKSAAEDENPDVRKHNEEMEHRFERTPNQLGEDDNKVNKNFWKGDVGPKKDNNK